MAAKGRSKAPRMLLIFCEGKTEEAYFNILLDFFRLPQYVVVEVAGQKGQHLALVDNIAKRRDELCAEELFRRDEIECWAVCDEDLMPVSFGELDRYAEERDVRLAFSAPQFEMYLLQHFEQSGSADRGEVFRRLTAYRKENGGEGRYDDSTKSDLGWIGVAIDRKPKIVSVAITNSDLRDRAAKRPFLTVQNLSRRILEMAL